jgi:hypothetical protein
MSLTPADLRTIGTKVYLPFIETIRKNMDTSQVILFPRRLQLSRVKMAMLEQRRVLTDENAWRRRDVLRIITINTILPGRHGTTGRSYTRLPNMKQGTGQLRRVSVASEDQLERPMLLS